VNLLHDISHGKRLARSGDAQQRLLVVAALDAVEQLGDSLGWSPPGWYWLASSNLLIGELYH